MGLISIFKLVEIFGQTLGRGIGVNDSGIAMVKPVIYEDCVWMWVCCFVLMRFGKIHGVFDNWD